MRVMGLRRALGSWAAIFRNTDQNAAVASPEAAGWAIGCCDGFCVCRWETAYSKGLLQSGPPVVISPTAGAAACHDYPQRPRRTARRSAFKPPTLADPIKDVAGKAYTRRQQVQQFLHTLGSKEAAGLKPEAWECPTAKLE
jgi:hypothetical protein